MINPLQSTYSMKVSEVKKKWIHVDAEGLILGRLASVIAIRLRGKHLPNFTPNIDSGDNVVITNVDKVVLTGNKLNDKIFYWHTGHPGGIKQRTARETMNSSNPERLLMKAIERMMPKTKLGRRQMSNLRFYVGPTHGHHGQVEYTLDVKGMNEKNCLRG